MYLSDPDLYSDSKQQINTTPGEIPWNPHAFTLRRHRLEHCLVDLVYTCHHVQNGHIKLYYPRRRPVKRLVRLKFISHTRIFQQWWGCSLHHIRDSCRHLPRSKARLFPDLIALQEQVVKRHLFGEAKQSIYSDSPDTLANIYLPEP